MAGQWWTVMTLGRGHRNHNDRGIDRGQYGVPNTMVDIMINIITITRGKKEQNQLRFRANLEANSAMHMTNSG